VMNNRELMLQLVYERQHLHETNRQGR
jgi:hypothetical protein